MIEDPLTRWPGQFPYRVLAGLGITPRSTQAEVKEVVFTLMVEDLMTPTTQQAANQLGDLSCRLLLDLLHYDLDHEAGLAELHAAVTRELPDSGAPDAVIEARTAISADLLARLTDELADPQPSVEPDSVPAPPLLDSLIQFDR